MVPTKARLKCVLSISCAEKKCRNYSADSQTFVLLRNSRVHDCGLQRWTSSRDKEGIGKRGS